MAIDTMLWPRYPVLGVILLVGTVLPMLAVFVRRLHDTDRSGWWYFIGLVPLIGGILLLIWTCSRGTNGPNRFGEDPLGGVDATHAIAA